MRLVYISSRATTTWDQRDNNKCNNNNITTATRHHPRNGNRIPANKYYDGMAQDTGHWSVRRPRETLGGLTLNSTAIPQPPSALKRSNSSAGPANNAGPVPFSTSGHMRSLSGSRHSLAPTRPNQPLFQRTSSSGNNQTTLADMGLASVKRSSVRQPFTPGMAGRASTDGGSDRRSSVYRGGRQSTVGTMGGMGGALGSGITSMGGGGNSHQSFFSQAPAPAGAMRDPRPLKDRSYLARIGQEVIEYMTQHNFELEMSHTLSQNVIKSPTQKDFVYMFQWLYRRIDPSYRFQKSIDQEVPLLMKQIRYPYEKGITKSQIAAVGGQNWGTFLGMLHWMMELAIMLERYASNRYDDACAEAGIDVVADHITFEFLAHAYQDWLVMDVDADGDDGQGTDDAEQLAKMLAPHIDNMTRQLDQAYAKHEEELAILEAEHAKLLQDISDLEKSTPDLAALDEDFKVMEEDKIKFEEYNDLALQRCERHETRIPLFQEELDKLMAEVEEAENEQRSLRQAVDDQGISMADIDRMNSERERLQKGIEAAGQRLEEAKRKVAEREVDASRKLEELERTVDRYNTLAYQIALIPETAANAKGRDYELRVKVNEGPSFGESSTDASMNMGTGNMETERLLADPVTGYLPGHILNLDLRGHVKNSFLALRKEVSERRSTALETMMKDHDLLDSIKEAMEDKRSEVEALEHRVRAAEQEHEKTKEVTTAQRLASDAQIEKMEKELAKMRASLSESVQLMEQREMNTNIEYEQLTLRASALREELHTEIMRMLNDVIKFKMHVQKNLEEYEEFVTEELVKELGDGEEAKQ
ncbi:kinetochore protein NDC80 [Sporothrix brasiliensis 5110]|uniref:Probable kinetochore protein NDC80 n=1 Tax=Sporothrix brasiliensis 5110 TaxID=1398154 RepID=A0A0C2J3T2_9PEZI|nr:kinetochore protein NDC80 [Sporothrix brasiliensis 5110]KIH91727.1 kinetochore protein NDC80 [Sporothrix brasiliensis 5110]